MIGKDFNALAEGSKSMSSGVTSPAKEDFKLGLYDYALKNNMDVNQLVKKLTGIKNEMPDGKSLQKDKNPLVERAENYLRDNYNRKISLSDIAERLNVNSSYLSRLFKQETGITLIEYLTCIRIINAVNLIKTSDLKVYEIAYKVGYDNVEHFSRVFKKAVGQSPKIFIDRKAKIGCKRSFFSVRWLENSPCN